jgi:hypothetical protein
VHERYGDEAALLAGDALISKAVSMSSRYGQDVMEAMSKASMEMCAGELLDYNFQRSKKMPSVKECLNISALKSASLIASCCAVVAVHKKNSYSKDMYRFGRDIGVAFQIRDDIIDYSSWAKAGRKGVLVPNIVSSIDAARRGRKGSALVEAGELNKKYMRSAYRRLGKGADTQLIKKYADLIMVKT